jgi:hypothetical protein
VSWEYLFESLAPARYPEYEINHTVDNIQTMVITTMSSTRVKARGCRVGLRDVCFIIKF